MKTRLMVGLVLGLTGQAWAQDAVLNDSAKTVEMARTIIGKLDPSYETLWNFRDGTFSQGVSASIYGFASHDIPVASLRMGVGTNTALYGGVGLDVPGLAKRFIPPVVKGFATVRPLDILWAVAGKYARVTPVGGYSWGDDAPIYGVTVGAAFSF